MAEYHLILPAMGESIAEATIIRWLKNEGDPVEEEDILAEIATDKVDSEVPSPVSGILKKKLFAPDQVAQVGAPIAILEVASKADQNRTTEDFSATSEEKKHKVSGHPIQFGETFKENPIQTKTRSDRFYSPLVRAIARKEGVDLIELDHISGSGKEGRLTKKDLLGHLKTRTERPVPSRNITFSVVPTSFVQDENHEMIEMDRMRKLIATHMIESRRIAAHVTSFVEADVTSIVLWRERLKEVFKRSTGIRLSFMPIFVQAIVRAIKDFPMINISVEGDKIIRKKDIHIGMATALADGNLIVPVIKNADSYNFTGLAMIINDLVDRARSNRLQSDEIHGGTYTITNIGSFGNISGTPIIHQPQVAIMAVGVIQKNPAVIETPEGDLIGVRHKMYLSHSYDHRVVDGALGGNFAKRVATYLENFDPDMRI
ncbi:MAG: dihydrolipoamide acetyltransferase family protein [Flavobacteriales bacterium Tduv]